MSKNTSEKVVLSRFDGTKFHAGPKAKRDIEHILKTGYGYEILSFDAGNGMVLKALNMASRLIQVNQVSRKADVLVVQWPYSNRKLYTQGISDSLTIIHDLDCLREQSEDYYKYEMAFLKRSRLIISHNEVMTKYLISQGIDPKKIITLGLFDYLVDEAHPIPEVREIHDTPEIVYCGNLDKSPFLFQLEPEKMNYKIQTYGLLEDEIKNPKIMYHGAVAPDEVPGILNGDLGLVWDGRYDDEDQDVFPKDYTKYNNPHKLSCYLAANMPVIVWRKSAIARLVKKYNLGYVIDNLYDINYIDFSDYAEKQKNAAQFGEKIRSGYFTRRAMDEANRRMQEN